MKQIKLSFGLLAVIMLAGCSLGREVSVPFTNTAAIPEYRDATADQLALALLTPDDIAAAVAAVTPLPLEFNGQLDTNLQDYDFYLARQWNDVNGDSIVGNAVTRYVSVAAAQANVADLAANCDAATDNPVGDITFICYVKPLLVYDAPSDPAYLMYRFTVGQYGARISVVDTGYIFDDNSVIYDRLQSAVYSLALAQAERLQNVLADDTTALTVTPAVEHLPAAPAGTSLLGTTALTAAEWLTLTGDDASELDGFTSGAIRRFLLTDRPDEVLEVIVLEFATAEQASGLAADFVAPPADSGILETQTAQERFFYDVSIFSPFDELDATEQDLTTYSDLILQ